MIKNGLNFGNASTINSTFGCSIGGHVRLWSGGLDAMPKVCQCGAVRYESHACRDCGVIHEHSVPNEARSCMIASESVLGRDWNKPEEDEAWRGL